jgi:HEAT repeat protein
VAADPQPPPKPAMPPGTPAEQVKTLIGQYDAASADFRKRYEAAKSDEEREKVFEWYPDNEAYAAVVLSVAEQHPKDPAAFDALLWAVKHARQFHADPVFIKARDTLARDYLTDPRIGPFCQALRRAQLDPTAPAILRDVLAKNPSKPAQAEAAYALAKVLNERAGFAELFSTKATPEQIEGFGKTYGKDVIATLKRADPAALRKEYEQLLERILADKDYAATVIDRGEAKVALGELADRELFSFRHLQPGKPAPDIAGEDVDGVKFKLSDYRGKVVLLDFWGHW